MSCQLTLNLGSMKLWNLNKIKAPSIEHHGGWKSHVFTLIYNFSAAFNQPSPSAVGQRVRKLKAKAAICKNPHTALPDLFCLLSLDSFPSLTSPFLLTHSPSLNVFLALPSQLSLIACEVINGFHLTSSPTLRRAPTNKTRAQHTNCPSEEP